MSSGWESFANVCVNPRNLRFYFLNADYADFRRVANASASLNLREITRFLVLVIQMNV